ncbi:hypothetical protein [Phycicoccus avicenniae]|uniref:hypothetical protein n=1 Tax=Phycicoccus avicenniae TaxID=2828860 RepID=UPI00201156EF|nr:hypothetical protein [Phycicoccus avicenniae]
MTLPVRRTAAALTLAAALVTAGCGSLETDRAATVDGRVITETEVQTVIEEVNAMGVLQQPFDPTSALTALVRADPALAFFEENGIVASESVAERDARQAGVREPSDATVRVLRFFNALNTAAQSQQFTPEDEQALVARINEQDIEVNPRFGDFDSDVAAVAPMTPEWIQSEPEAAAP